MRRRTSLASELPLNERLTVKSKVCRQQFPISSSTATKPWSSREPKKEKRKPAEKMSPEEEAASAQVVQASDDAAGPQQPAAPVPLYWQLSIPEISRVTSKRGILPSTFTPVDKPHVTLLYVGGESTDEAAAKKAGVTVDQLRDLRERLQSMEGDSFEVKVTQIVIEESVAVAVVSLPPTIPCANKFPHVTLALQAGAVARASHDVLEDVQAGRTDGINVMPLPTPRPMRGTLSLEYSSPSPSHE